VTSGTDSFFALASVVAGELYDQPLPVLALEPEVMSTLPQGAWASLDAEGALTITEG
jgi:hypothetical protein